MADIPIGLQLYSVRQDCEADLPAVLDQVAEMGYAGVDFAGYYGRDAQELRAMLDQRGLACCGCHAPLASVQDDQLAATIDFALALGIPYLVVPGLPEEWRNSPDAWRRTADFFNRLAEKLQPHGLRTGYHNHAVEFQPLDGELPWVVLGEATRPDVILQLDTGNCLHGGGDPVAMLERFPGRSTTVHLKEYSEDDPKALIGEGQCPWDDIFDRCERLGGTEWYIVEQESYAYPPLECVRRCLDNLRKMGKA
ncbi:MAG: sugar phosphate isomerase/epimerase family protein [Candidatus Brocadiia bacterium]